MHRRSANPGPKAAADAAVDLPPWFFWIAGIAFALALAFPFKPVKYILAAVLGTIWIRFVWRVPHHALLLFILGMPVLDLLPPDLIPIPALNVETIVVLTLGLAAWNARAAQPTPSPPNATLKPLGFHIALLVVAAIISVVSADGVYALIQGRWVRLGAWDFFAFVKNRVAFMFLLPIAFRMLWTSDHVRLALRYVAISTLLVSVEGLWEAREIFTAGFRIESNRVAGLVADQPNLFGGFLAMMILILLPIAIGRGITRRERLLYFGSIGAACGALLFTLSRGSWLALVLASSVVLAFRGLRLLPVVAAIVLSAPLWLPQSVVDRVNETTANNEDAAPGQELDDSAQVRLDQWRALGAMWKEAPIFGHGLRGFPQLWAVHGPHRVPKAAHSSIIELTVEMGALGLISYAWLLGAAWRLRSTAVDPVVSNASVGLMAALLCLIVLDCSGTRFRNGEVMAYIWVVGGALVRLANTGSGSGRPQEDPAPRQPLPSRRMRPRAVPPPLPTR
jgi:O-antigen ligase